jgi:hypothetical protein
MMIGSHGIGRWTAMEEVFVMEGRCDGHQNRVFPKIKSVACLSVGLSFFFVSFCQQI